MHIRDDNYMKIKLGKKCFDEYNKKLKCFTKVNHDYGHPNNAYDYYLQICLENNICWQCQKKVRKLHKRTCSQCQHAYNSLVRRDLENQYVGD
jgi:hypothetical protein